MSEFAPAIRPAAANSGRLAPHARRGRAFTLVEVLLAVTIGGILVASMVSSTRAITRSRAGIDLRAQRVAEARRGMEALLGALRNIRRDPEPAASASALISGRRGIGPGGSDRIDFQMISDTVVRSGHPESDQQEVSFFLQTVGDDKLPSLMCRRDHGLDEHVDDGGRVTLVARGIVGLEFEYFAAGEWHQEWDATEPQPPQAVRVTLAAAGAPATPVSGDPEVVVLTSAVAFQINPPPERNQQGGGSPQAGGRP